MPVTMDDKQNPPAEPDVQEVKRDTAPSTLSKQDLPVSKEKEIAEPQSYVHLADGTVLRVNDTDIPASAGAGNPNGFWQRGNKVFHVVGVYPVETVVEES